MKFTSIAPSLAALCFVLTAGVFVYAQEATPPPAPVVTAPVQVSPGVPVIVTAPVDYRARVDFLTQLGIQIVIGIGAVLTAALAMWAKIGPQISALFARQEALEGRQNRQAENTGAMQKQITDTALKVESNNPTLNTPSSGPSVIVALIASLALFGCATNTGNTSTDRRGRITNAVGIEVFNAITRAAIGAGQNAIAGQNGQDAASAAWTAAVRVDGTEVLHNLLVAYAGPQITPVAAEADKQIAKVNPQTPAEKTQLLNVIGSAVQLAANYYAAK